MSIATLFGQTSPYYTTDPTYYSNSTDLAEASAYAGFSMMMLTFMLLLTVAAYVISAIFLSRIFKKAGVEGWKAWVPIYNSWTLLELGGQKGFWAVLAIVPFVNIVAVIFMYIAMYNIGLKLGKEGAFVLLAIFLPIVWLIWLAVDNSTWKGAPAPQANKPGGNDTPSPVQ